MLEYEVIDWTEVEAYEDVKVFKKTRADVRREAFLKKKQAREREEQRQRRLAWKRANG